MINGQWNFVVKSVLSQHLQNAVLTDVLSLRPVAFRARRSLDLFGSPADWFACPAIFRLAVAKSFAAFTEFVWKSKFFNKSALF